MLHLYIDAFDCYDYFVSDTHLARAVREPGARGPLLLLFSCHLHLYPTEQQRESAQRNQPANQLPSAQFPAPPSLQVTRPWSGGNGAQDQSRTCSETGTGDSEGRGQRQGRSHLIKSNNKESNAHDHGKTHRER